MMLWLQWFRVFAFALLLSLAFSVSADTRRIWKEGDVVTESLFWCLSLSNVEEVVSLYIEGEIVEGRKLRAHLIRIDACRFVAGGVVVLTSVEKWRVAEGRQVYVISSSTEKDKGIFAIVPGEAVAEI